MAIVCSRMLRCPGGWADLEWNNSTNDVKFIKHNT